jgi:hypothetical protein
MKKKKEENNHQRQAAHYPPSHTTPREKGHDGASKNNKKAGSTTKWCLTHRTNKVNVTHSLIYNEDALTGFFNKRLIIQQNKKTKIPHASGNFFKKSVMGPKILIVHVVLEFTSLVFVFFYLLFFNFYFNLN